MKRLLSLIILITSVTCSAFEIQCNTNHDNLDIVLKTSPQSGVTYLIPISGNAVSPIPLKPKLLYISDRYVFYKAENLRFVIDRKDGDGLVSVKNIERIMLSNCEMTDREE